MVFSFLGGGKDGSRPPSGPPSPSFPGPALVRAYWEELRKGGAIPKRADLDPRAMADVLDQVFVAERIGTGLLRLRIAGMALADVAGLDMKGMPLSCLFLPEARTPLADVVERVLTRPEAIELQLEADRSIGRPALQARLLLLPLRSNAGGRDLVLGCLATSGALGRAPRRFAITRVVAQRLDVPRVAQRAPAPPARAFADPPAPAPTPAPVPPMARPLVGRPHLRLVHSAD